jgi:hypothetical protein
MPLAVVPGLGAIFTTYIWQKAYLLLATKCSQGPAISVEYMIDCDFETLSSLRVALGALRVTPNLCTVLRRFVKDRDRAEASEDPMQRCQIAHLFESINLCSLRHTQKQRRVSTARNAQHPHASLSKQLHHSLPQMSESKYRRSRSAGEPSYDVGRSTMR